MYLTHHKLTMPFTLLFTLLFFIKIKVLLIAKLQLDSYFLGNMKKTNIKSRQNFIFSKLKTFPEQIAWCFLLLLVLCQKEIDTAISLKPALTNSWHWGKVLPVYKWADISIRPVTWMLMQLRSESDSALVNSACSIYMDIPVAENCKGWYYLLCNDMKGGLTSYQQGRLIKHVYMKCTQSRIKKCTNKKQSLQ